MNNLFFINVAAEDYHTKLENGEPMPRNFTKPDLPKQVKKRKPKLTRVKKI